MKLVTYRGPEGRAVGVLLDGEVAPVASFPDMLALIGAGEDGLAAARDAAAGAARHALDAVRLLAPIPEPPQMRDALTFERHLRQARANRHLFDPSAERVAPEAIDVPRVWYEQPIYYKCNRFSVSGPGDVIEWPRGETRLDYELELAVVIGRAGEDIARGRGLDHVFGYMIFDDFSARDLQMAEMAGGLGPAKGKDFRTANALGPCLVTRDELGDGAGLRMRARVNGETWSDGDSSEMHHGFARIVEHVSTNEALRPGEVIGSGTVGGGCGLELGRFLSPGDRVALEIEGIGVLENEIGPRPEASGEDGR